MLTTSLDIKEASALIATGFPFVTIRETSLRTKPTYRRGQSQENHKEKSKVATKPCLKPVLLLSFLITWANKSLVCFSQFKLGFLYFVTKIILSNNYSPKALSTVLSIFIRKSSVQCQFLNETRSEPPNKIYCSFLFALIAHYTEFYCITYHLGLFIYSYFFTYCLFYREMNLWCLIKCQARRDNSIGMFWSELKWNIKHSINVNSIILPLVGRMMPDRPYSYCKLWGFMDLTTPVLDTCRTTTNGNIPPNTLHQTWQKSIKRLLGQDMGPLNPAQTLAATIMATTKATNFPNREAQRHFQEGLKNTLI